MVLTGLIRLIAKLIRYAVKVVVGGVISVGGVHMSRKGVEPGGFLTLGRSEIGPIPSCQ